MAEVVAPDVCGFILRLIEKQQPRLTGELQVIVAEAIAKMTPPKTNKCIQQLFESGVIVKRRIKEQDQATGKYSDVWHLPGAPDTITYVQELEEAISAAAQATAVCVGTRFQMLFVERLRKLGLDDDTLAKVRLTHQETVVMLRRSIDDAIAKNDWPWNF